MRVFKTVCAAMIGAALCAGAASAADYVILDSTAAGIEPGIVVDGGADVSIPNGAQVVLIDPAGETVVVDGPYDGTLSAAAASGQEGLGSALGRLTTSRGEDTTVLGAVRAPQISGGSVTE